MLGAIAGDVIGSIYERAGLKTTAFPLFDARSRFTDDTVLTIATARALLNGDSFADAYYELGRRYPHAGYGGAFRQWLRADTRAPYGSWGNGSAMRVSPVGFAATSVDDTLTLAAQSAAATHDHPEGVKGAQAVALAVFMARAGESKAMIREDLSNRFDYDLARRIDEIRPSYSFDVSCQGSVPEALIAFLDAENFEEAIRLAISLGGDADTQAAIAGGVGQAFWGRVPEVVAREVLARLPDEFVETINEFNERFAL